MKVTLKQWVWERRYEDLLRLARQDKKVLPHLLAFLYDREDVLCWRAVEALGQVAAVVARQDLEFVRNVMRRLLWSLNDESGSVGWFAPQALGAIIAPQPHALADFIPVVAGLLDLEETTFRPGTLWALGRIGLPVGTQCPALIPRLMPLLSTPEAETRGLAAWCMGPLQVSEAVPALREMVSDAAPLQWFANGELGTTTVGQLARAAGEKIAGREFPGAGPGGPGPVLRENGVEGPEEPETRLHR